MLGKPKDRDWALIANYADRTRDGEQKIYSNMISNENPGKGFQIHYPQNASTQKLDSIRKRIQSLGMGYQEIPEHEASLRDGKGERAETGTGKGRKCSLNLMSEQTIFAKNP